MPHAAALRPDTRTLSSADALRVLAILGVICLHTDPFSTADLDFDPFWEVTAQFLISTLALFAVPYFFAASGYFFGLSCRRSGSITTTTVRFLRRIGLLIVFWNAAYGVMAWSVYDGKWSPTAILVGGVRGMARDVAAAPVHVLLHGSSYQLWFLTALAMAALIVACTVRLGGMRVLPLLAMAIYACGLLGQGYPLLHPGARPSVNTLVGPFFGTPLFTLGYVLSGHNLGRKERDTALILGGLALLFMERLLFTKWLHWPDAHYYVGSIPLAAGLIRFAANRPHWLAHTPLPALGRLTLGVYAIHVAVMHAIDAVYFPLMDLPLWQFLFPLAVYALSIALVWGLSRVPLVQRLVQ